MSCESYNRWERGKSATDRAADGVDGYSLPLNSHRIWPSLCVCINGPTWVWDFWFLSHHPSLTCANDIASGEIDMGTTGVVWAAAKVLCTRGPKKLKLTNVSQDLDSKAIEDCSCSCSSGGSIVDVCVHRMSNVMEHAAGCFPLGVAIILTF